MPTKASIISQDINRAIKQTMDGNKEGAKALQNLLKDPQTKTRTADRLRQARQNEETRIDNGISQMGNLSCREGELQLIIKVAQRTAHILDEKTVMCAFLGSRNETLADWKERRKQHEETMAHAKEEEPEQAIRRDGYAFRGPTIKAKMQLALKQCGIRTIEYKLLPDALRNNFTHRMDEVTQGEVVRWLSGELQKRKDQIAGKDEGLFTKIKDRFRGT